MVHIDVCINGQRSNGNFILIMMVQDIIDQYIYSYIEMNIYVVLNCFLVEVSSLFISIQKLHNSIRFIVPNLFPRDSCEFQQWYQIVILYG